MASVLDKIKKMDEKYLIDWLPKPVLRKGEILVGITKGMNPKGIYMTYDV